MSSRLLFRKTVANRLGVLREHLTSSGQPNLHIQLETEIKAVMLELLVNNFFGAEVDYDQLRNRYIPALQRVIDRIVRDSVLNKLGIPMQRLPPLTRGLKAARDENACFDELTDVVLATRKDGRGLWRHFKSDAPDAALRSNLKVFLAGALEATTSFASWAVSHLARSPLAQERVFEEVKAIDDYTPEALESATYLDHVLDETLRLTPSLYFLPRRATRDTWVETADGRKMLIPRKTHILLDVWHANRHEDHWGLTTTGYRALDFKPERWAEMAAQGRASKEVLHFGFGYGPRVCPGMHLGRLEVALAVGALVKVFRFHAENLDNPPKAGVSTKPLDGTSVVLELRERYRTSPIG